jgi:PAS domain S-box-containing protein
MPEQNLKKIQQELERTKEDLEDLQCYISEFSAALPVAVCSLSGIGVIVFTNRAFQILTGYKVMDIVGKFIGNIFLEKKKINDFLENTREQKTIENKELVLVTQNKNEIRVSVSFSVREDSEGNFVGYFISIINITESTELREKLEEKVDERTQELEKAKEALMNMLEDAEYARWKAEEEKNRTMSIITNFTDGLLFFDKRKRFSLINPKAKYFFEIDKGKEIIGKSISELPCLRPLVGLLKQNKKVSREEIHLKKNLILEVTIVAISVGKIIVGHLVILHDITREKLIEKMKTEFVSLAAHQLRTPLSAVKWTIKIFLEGDLGKLNKEQKEFLKDAYDANERMIILINNLLNITRIEEGRYIYEPILINMKDLVQEIVDSHKAKARKEKIEVKFNYPKRKLGKINVDIEKMTMVLVNLLNNAIRYTPSGGKIIVSLSQTKKEVCFSIEDTGIGIPKNQHKRVFTKFFRATNAIRKETEGTGLGLYIAKNIVEAHKGKIWFESKENKGSIFYISLPIKN